LEGEKCWKKNRSKRREDVSGTWFTQPLAGVMGGALGVFFLTLSGFHDVGGLFEGRRELDDSEKILCTGSRRNGGGKGTPPEKPSKKRRHPNRGRKSKGPGSETA